MDAKDDAPDIAVIGMAGRFPGALDVDTFWQNLRDGVESIRPVTDAELEALGVGEAERHDPRHVKAAAVLEGMDRFDAAFFGFSPREAELMDPQHRVFLECCWAAIEDAGIAVDACRGAVGVFGGASTNTYLVYNLVSNPSLLLALDPMQIDVGSGADYLSTRVAYKLDLRGPSYTVQSGCSTSLLAVHVACQSLLAGECDMALAGGVSIQVKHPEGYRYMPGGVGSPDGHCRAFDARAEGTVFGSGAGVVVLKRLADALADGDAIRAVVKGSAVNNDGAAKVGYTAPGVDGQAAVIREALSAAGVEPRTIGVVEAHGTGTQLGDPIEVRALTRAFRAGKGGVRADDPPCLLGSLKSNIGHLSGAAGVASLIKTVLMLEHRQVAPSLHFETPNPEMDLASTPFRVATALTDWPPREDYPRRAGVSSFGVGGTNVHVVLEEAQAKPVSGPSRPAQILVISAKTRPGLDAATENLAQHLRAHPEVRLADVAHTLQVGRQAMSVRRALVAVDRDDALAALASSDAARLLTKAPSAVDRPVAFLFPGQGAQYVDMARGLYEAEPVFREQLDTCIRLLRPHLDVDLGALIYPTAASAEDAARRLTQTAITQAALFSIEYALAKLWMAWGVKPRAMLGHSIGEYVAACLAGVFSLPDALALVAARGQLMQALPAGAMASVLLPEDRVRAHLSGALSIAAVNGPASTVVSGPTPEIEALTARLVAEGATVQRLHTSRAFHSAMMDPIVAPFAARVREVALQPPQIAYVSNMTGAWIEAAEATDPAYWASHLREPVRFAAGLDTLSKGRPPILLEVGPGDTLSRLARPQIDEARGVVVPSTRHPRAETSDVNVLLGALGRVWLNGGDVDWAGFAAHERRRRVPLPTYPFERKRHWVDARPLDAIGERTKSAATSDAPVTDPRADTPEGHGRPALETEYVPPRTETERAVSDVWREVLGVDPIGVHDNFFDLGGHSLLAAQLRNQIHATIGVDLALASLFQTPTVAAVAAAVDEDRRQQAEATEKPIAERVRAAFPTDRPRVLEQALRRWIARGLGITVDELPSDGQLGAFDLHRVGAELEHHLKRAFKFQLYPHEVQEHPSVPELARYLLSEMDRLADPARFVSEEPLSAYPLRPYRPADHGRSSRAATCGRKNPGMVFVHSSPRAGSTLFRVMLAGHPQLFCPPEVNLLFFEDAAEWRRNIGFGSEMEWTTRGLEWAFMELLGLDSAAGRALVDDLVTRNVSAQEIYGRLQELARPRILVDKTPSYALDLDTLRRAEALFDGPKYIYLYRHPYPVMESILRVRFDRLFARGLFGRDDLDPHVVAETVWALANRNLLAFFDGVEERRRHFLRYEDLVRDPRAAMTGVCDFLGIPFDERVIAPYDGKRERMIGGLGDPNILQHKSIEADLGDAWRRIKWPRRLDASTRAVVERLGYELAEVAPTTQERRFTAEEASRLLAEIDTLPEDQVTALLEQLSTERKVR